MYRYRKVKKPRWTPSEWVFGPAWAGLYLLMGFSSWSVWTHGGWEKQKVPLMFYGLTLLLSLVWTPIIFRTRKFDLALLVALGKDRSFPKASHNDQSSILYTLYETERDSILNFWPGSSLFKGSHGLALLCTGRQA